MHTQSGAVQGQGYGTRVRDDELQDVLVLIAVSELKLCQHLREMVLSYSVLGYLPTFQSPL